MKDTFAKKLYEGLQAAGVRPFLDAHDIDRGKATWNSILEAIRVAPVCICVFSPGYAESSWCLDELAAIHRSSGKQILPVFYHVKPFHLRYPEALSSPFAEGLSKQGRRYGAEKMEEWKDCLTRSANLYGFELERFFGYFKTSSKRMVFERVVGICYYFTGCLVCELRN